MYSTNKENPLSLEDKMYTVQEFAFAIRSNFGVNDSLPDEILVKVFIDKYPMYACKIIKDIKSPGGCSCC